VDWVEANLQVSFVFHLYIFVLQLEIQLSKGENLDLINEFNPATFVCLSQDRPWVSSVIYRGIFLYSVNWSVRRLYVLLKCEAVVRFVEVWGGCTFCWGVRWLYVLLRCEVVARFVEVWGGCAFCWYWWNSWPSLFINFVFNNRATLKETH
jgi:hypothetical protein